MKLEGKLWYRLSIDTRLIEVLPRIQGIYLIIYHYTNKIYIGESGSIPPIRNHISWLK